MIHVLVEQLHGNKMKQKLSILLYVGLMVFISCTSTRGVETEAFIQSNRNILPPESFREVWAYLMKGEEQEFHGNEPITDLCYFSAELDYRGALINSGGLPDSIKRNKKIRTHLVIANISNMYLMHFVLNPDLGYRKKLIDDILLQAKQYDGVQIDFESIHPNDKNAFLSFMADLKKGLGDKTLSVAVPARTYYVDDAFDYKALARIADRIFIMAYDQHWSGSKPGPIASPEWCGEVAQYAKSKIPVHKIVFGIPFYGRSWQDKKNDRAYRFRSIRGILDNTQSKTNIDTEYPSFTFEDTVRVSVFYEDENSLLKKARLYKSMGIDSIGFWRLGQENRVFWGMINSSETVTE
jgi:spore germination protein